MNAAIHTPGFVHRRATVRHTVVRGLLTSPLMRTTAIGARRRESDLAVRDRVAAILGPRAAPGLGGRTRSAGRLLPVGSEESTPDRAPTGRPLRSGDGRARGGGWAHGGDGARGRGPTAVRAAARPVQGPPAGPCPSGRPGVSSPIPRPGQDAGWPGCTAGAGRPGPLQDPGWPGPFGSGSSLVPEDLPGESDRSGEEGDTSALPGVERGVPSAAWSSADNAGRGRRRGSSSLAARMPPVLHGLLEFDRRTLAGLALLLVLAVGYAVQHFWAGRPRVVAVPAGGPPVGAAGPVPGVHRARPDGAAPFPPFGSSARFAGPAPSATATATATVVVDVAGKVRHPGLRTLPAGARVADALRAAGGPRPGTGTGALNLARVLSDGEQILVGVPGAARGGGQGAGAASGGGAGAGPAGAPVDLNTATVEQLDTLPGVGPALARHIVEYRTAHSGFGSVDQLRQVSGIGERKYADLRPLVTV